MTKKVKMYQNISGVNHTARKLFLKIIESLSLEQLNKIPEGFNNNIIWNIAHTIVTQQLLLYKLSNTTMKLPNDFIEQYKKGSVPKNTVDQQEVDFIKSKLIKSITEVDKDVKNNIFGEFNTYPTSTGFELASIEDAIPFNLFHEGIHLGYVLAQKRILLNS